MRCCSLKMVEKNESESAQLVCLYSQFPNWLIHFQELESMLGTKFLQKVCWILQLLFEWLQNYRLGKVGLGFFFKHLFSGSTTSQKYIFT